MSAPIKLLISMGFDVVLLKEQIIYYCSMQAYEAF